MTEPTQDPMNDPIIQGEVVATGTIVNSTAPRLGELMERAMVDAINACYARGVTDVDSILAAKMEALERVKAEYAHLG